MFTYLDRFEFTTIFQWPNISCQPYPLAPYGGVPHNHFLTGSTYPPEISEHQPSSRARSLPSGRTTRARRGNSSASGSKPSKSIARSAGGSRAKPYDNAGQAQELRIFNEAIWHLAKRWFIVKLWRENCFFLKADEDDTKVDRCAIEAYEAAISEYYVNNPDGAAHIAKYRLQPQSTDALVKCRQVVSAIIETCIHHYSNLS